jgi:DNA polymerase III subunit beta
MEVQTTELLAELQWTARFIEKKSTITNVMFVADGGRLTLTATDLEIGGITSIAGTPDKWAITAPAQKLINYLCKIDEPTVNIFPNPGNLLTVEVGQDKIRVSGMSSENFPVLPTFPERLFSIRNLPQAAERTAFAISSEETRFSLTGALLEVIGGVGKMVATDSHRLALAPLRITAAEDCKFRALIPKKPLLEGARLEEGDCGLSMDEEHIFMDFGQRRIVSRKLKGNFPDYPRVLRAEYPSHAIIPVKRFLKTLERVAIWADARSRAVRFTFVDGACRMFASSVEEGEAGGVVPVGIAEGSNPVEIGLNADYVIDVLSRTDAQSIGYAWQDEKSVSEFVSKDGWRTAIMSIPDVGGNTNGDNRRNH